MLLEKQLDTQGGQVRDKKGQLIRGTPQPTIPVVAFDANEDDMQMRHDGSGARPRPGYKHSPSDLHLTHQQYSNGANGSSPIGRE
jgi:hypothetical protein